MEISKLVERLKIEEGWRASIYLDTTGNLTIGYGCNLARVSGDFKFSPVSQISRTAGEVILRDKIGEVAEDLEFAWPWFAALDDVRQRVLVDMAFNLGVPGLLKWPRFREQVRLAQYELAATNMEATLWRKQVGSRALVLAEMMRTGQDPT